MKRRTGKLHIQLFKHVRRVFKRKMKFFLAFLFLLWASMHPFSCVKGKLEEEWGEKYVAAYFLPVFFSKIYAEGARCPIFWREKCPLGFFSPKILYGSYFSSVWGSVFDLWNIFWLLMEPRASSGLVPVALICIFHNEKLHYGHLIKGKISLFLRPRRVILLRKQYATGRPHKIFISHFHFF